MDLDKSLYMSDFLKVRESIGTIDLYQVSSPLFTNLYSEFRPKQQEKIVEEVVEEIKDKTIHLLKKEDQSIFFPDLPELDIKEAMKEETPEIKKIQVTERVELLGGGMDPNVKRISIRNDYVVPSS
jgi:hypothetical protein